MSGASQPSSSDSINGAQLLLSQFSLDVTQVIRHGEGDYRLSPTNISKWIAKENDNVIVKTWISLAGASSLTFLVCIIHSFELMGLATVCMPAWLIGCSYLTTLIGIALILLAFPFNQLLGYALLLSILVSSVSGCLISAYLQKELQSTSAMIKEMQSFLERIKITEDDTEGEDGGGVGPASVATTPAPRSSIPMLPQPPPPRPSLPMWPRPPLSLRRLTAAATADTSLTQ